MTLPFTDEELDAAGLLGEGNSPFVVQAMKTMREHPELLSLSLFTLKCMNDSGHTPPTINPASSATLSINLDTTDVSPCIVSDWERTTYYNGISTEHPELLYRSDLLENPFPIPTGRHPPLPTKTVCGVFNTPLNTVWDIVAPQICELLKTRNIRYSVIKTARFVTHGEDGKDTLGPVVIWIATHPTTTTAQNAHDASPDILSLLRANGVEDVVVEWYEGTVERLSGPSLLRVADITNPTHYVRRHLTPVLGMPIATAEREGSVTFFFHENKNKDGTPSTKVFGVSNCHVLRKNTSVTYEFKGVDEPPRYVQLAGPCRFSRGLAEIKTAISRHGSDANLLATTIVELQAMPKSEDPEQVEENEVAIKSRRENLIKVQKDMKILEAFYKEIENQWSDPDIPKRTIGHVHWAPEISVDTQGHKYTKDIGTFEVDPVKFKAHFKGNVIDLGTKFTHHELTAMFYPLSDSRTVFKYPTDRQFRINNYLSRELLAVPDCTDNNGEPCLIVMKDGNTTDLTIGKYAGLEAYLCSSLGAESIELAIYNYDTKSGPFSDKGDSGSLIVDGEGRMVGILHSGMPKGGANHVTFATPAWWAIEQLKLEYPYADFSRTTF